MHLFFFTDYTFPSETELGNKYWYQRIYVKGDNWFNLDMGHSSGRWAVQKDLNYWDTDFFYEFEHPWSEKDGRSRVKNCIKLCWTLNLMTNFLVDLTNLNQTNNAIRTNILLIFAGVQGWNVTQSWRKLLYMSYVIIFNSSMYFFVNSHKSKFSTCQIPLKCLGTLAESVSAKSPTSQLVQYSSKTKPCVHR